MTLEKTENAGLTVADLKSRIASIRTQLERSELSRVVIYTLLYKVVFFIVVYFSYQLLPFNHGALNANLNYPPNEPVTFLTTLKTWDGQHYHYLAEEGYSAENMSNAFYPLYPAGMTAVASIFGISAAWAGLLISNILSIGAAAFLYLLSREFMSVERATATVVLYLTYPVAFYTNILYSESLFLFLILGLFYGLYKENIGLSILMAFLLPLSRPQGVLVGFILIFFYFWKHRKQSIYITRNKETLVLLVFPIGVMAYFLFMYLKTGSLAAGFEAQKHFISGNSVMNIFNIKDWFVRNFANVDLSFHGFTNSVLDRLFFAFYAVMLFVIYKKTDLTLFCYSLVIGLIPALSASFMSYSRYTLVIFPMFMALALILKSRYYVIAILFAALQSVFAINHTLNNWMG